MKRSLAAALLATLASTALAQETPSLFISLTAGRAPSKANVLVAPTPEIPAPGGGWAWSAAAPVAGTTWNLIPRPTPIPSNRNTKPGLYVCNSANDTALASATGVAGAARLAISLDIQDLDPGASRTEPNGSRAGATELGPLGLMDTGWALYRPGNMSVHKVSGIKPDTHYLLYVYSSSEGNPGGARFTLDSANIPSGKPGHVETSGSPAGNVFQSAGGTISPVPPATPGTSSSPADSTTWGRLHAVADASGSITFRTGKNSSGSHYVNGYQLIPFPAPAIAVQPPAALAAKTGDSVSLSVAATGEGDVTYLWRKNGAPLTDNLSSSTAELKLELVAADTAGTYDVVVANPGSSVVSQSVVLDVAPPPSVETSADIPTAAPADTARKPSPKRPSAGWPVR